MTKQFTTSSTATAWKDNYSVNIIPYAAISFKGCSDFERKFRMNFLNDLYFDKINPSEKCFDRDSKYAKYSRIAVENETKLKAYLSSLPNPAEKQQLLEQLVGAYIEIDSFSEYDRFVEGFRLGADIMLDTFVAPQQSIIRDISWHIQSRWFICRRLLLLEKDGSHTGLPLQTRRRLPV